MLVAKGLLEIFVVVMLVLKWPAMLSLCVAEGTNQRNNCASFAEALKYREKTKK